MRSSLSKRSDSLLGSSYFRVAVALIAIVIVGAFVGAPRLGAVSDPIQRGIDAGAARYQALGAFYLAQAGGDVVAADSPRPYTDVSKFYVERLRAQIRQNSALADSSELADNPELLVARRFYSAPTSSLAVNPELILVRGFYSAPTNFLALNPELILARGFYSAPTSFLAANPELILARRSYSPGLGTCSPDGLELAADPEFATLRKSC
jgi:hypothetical protein